MFPQVPGRPSSSGRQRRGLSGMRRPSSDTAVPDGTASCRARLLGDRQVPPRRDVRSSPHCSSLRCDRLTGRTPEQGRSSSRRSSSTRRCRLPLRPNKICCAATAARRCLHHRTRRRRPGRRRDLHDRQRLAARGAATPPPSHTIVTHHPAGRLLRDARTDHPGIDVEEAPGEEQAQNPNRPARRPRGSRDTMPRPRRRAGNRRRGPASPEMSDRPAHPGGR